MQRKSVTALIQALSAADVRYLLVGGLAVVAHGYVRFTADVDVVLDLQDNNVRRAIAALTGLGYRPHAPVPFEDFLDPTKRADWVRDKGLTVFSLSSPEHPATEIDLFVEAPFDFDEAYTRAVRMELAPDVTATFVGLDDLLVLKQRAGRPQDTLDIQQLIALNEDRSDEG